MKKGAVAGAVVWSVPVLTSTPAFAATGRCSGSKPCTDFYYVKNEKPGTDDSSCSDTSDGNNQCPNFTTADLSCDGASTPAVKNGCDLVHIFFTEGSATFTYDPGVIPIIIQLKPGSTCFTYNYDENTETFSTRPGTTPLPPGCTPTFVKSMSNGSIVITVTYPKASCPAGLSHVSTYFCYDG